MGGIRLNSQVGTAETYTLMNSSVVYWRPKAARINLHFSPSGVSLTNIYVRVERVICRLFQNPLKLKCTMKNISYFGTLIALLTRAYHALRNNFRSFIIWYYFSQNNQ